MQEKLQKDTESRKTFRALRECIRNYYQNLWILLDNNGKSKDKVMIEQVKDYIKAHEITSGNEKNFKERLAWFNKVNAILETSPEERLGATLYVTDEPCLECTKVIIASGITRVIYRKPYTKKEVDFFLDAPHIEIIKWED